MKKVAFFITALDAGGIETYLLRFITYCGDRIDAFVYCKSGRLGDLEQQYRAVGAHLRPLCVGNFNIFEFVQLKKELKKEKFDAVCDFTGNFAGIVMLIAKQINIKKRITWYRGATNHFKETRIKLFYNNIVKRLTLKYSTNILSNSVSALDFFFPNRDKEDTTFNVIYNGIDSNQFLSTDEDLRSELNIQKESFVIGHVGRYTEAKNHNLIIKVAIELCEKHENIHFIMCGKGVPEKFSETINKHNLSSKIHLLEYRPDVIKVLNSLNCFYFPSITEGQPNALIEALIAGLPFVASNIIPIKEIIPAEYHDQLIDIESVDSSCKQLLRIYNNEVQINLKQWTIKKFDSKKLFEKFLQVLSS